MKKEQEILAGYLRQKGLKHTGQRDKILDSFLSASKHISADELHSSIRKSDPQIGFSTVYRTLKLLTECGLATEVNFGDGRARFEKSFDKSQHGHLICTGCGKTEEFDSKNIEKSLKKISIDHDVKPHGYRIEVYGLCKKCQ